MSKRENIIDSFTEDDDRKLAAKIIDDIDYVQKHYEPKFTDFLDPASASKAERILLQYRDINHAFTSCIEGCERNICVIYPDYMDIENISIPVSVLMIKFKSRFEKLSHRDVLGAILNLGIKRDVTGDIIINDDRCYIFVLSDISYYIILNLKIIKHAPVEVEYVNFKDVPKKKEAYKIITSTIASERLDCVLGCGFGESRSSISQEILKGNVKVNWEEVKDLSHTIKAGDVISLKGHGRMIIDSMEGVTRKGRLNIVIKRIL